MRRLSLFSLFSFFALSAPAVKGRFFLSPDLWNDRVVFTYENDLWTARVSGETAHRITSHPGSERYAKFSPDGQWIAFTGTYDGGRDVYIIPSMGGEPRRLTHHPATDRVIGFTADGSAVLFTSCGNSSPVYTKFHSRVDFPRSIRLTGSGMPPFHPTAPRSRTTGAGPTA